MQAIDHQSQRSRTAVITGAGSAEGIGFASARSLGLRGATIIITSTTARIHDRLEELRAQGITALGVCGDLTDPAEARRLIEIALAHTGRVDILVNNAGMSSISNSVNAAKLSDLSDTDWQAAIASNLTTAFNVTRQVLPHMADQKYGRIVNVTSVSGPTMAFPSDAGYHAAKAALLGLTRSTAIDYANCGITCNAVAPGWIGTSSATEAEIDAGNACPLGRPGTADEVAHAIASLTDPLASYITGQILIVDGGNSIQEDHAGNIAKPHKALG
jgi:3-oxoacyl-[acyl-carrier protein] reductase